MSGPRPVGRLADRGSGSPRERRSRAGASPRRSGSQAGSEVDQAVRALQRGADPDSCFRVVFERYNAPLNRFFARKGFSSDDCQDLTQETFVGIYKGVKGFRREARFETWVYTVARTTYLKRLRRDATAKRAAVEVSLDSTMEHSPQLSGAHLSPAELEAEDRRRVMRKAISELPEKMRRCLILRIYQDLSYREIATVMRLKIDTVKAHLFQARKRLQQRLGGGSGLVEITPGSEQGQP